jgi:hypothetical protein
MKKTSLIAASLMACSAAATTAFAANTGPVLSTLQAPVMVNQGAAYVEANQSMQLNTGDRLMVMQGGRAEINYANGCVQTIQSNEIATIGTEESCVTAQSAGTYNQVGTPPPTTGGGSSAAAGGGIDTAGLVFSAIVAGGLIHGATDGNSSSGGGEPPSISP